MNFKNLAAFWLVSLALAGCGQGGADAVSVPGATGGAGGGGTASGGGGGQPAFQEPGSEIALTEPEAVVAERAALTSALAEVEGLTPDGLRAKYPTAFQPAPSYDLESVAGLSLIQGSSLALDAAELAALAQQGFVVSDRWRTPSFTYGYATIYLEDLPVYVSADSILFALHRSYDKILAAVETGILIPDLDVLLAGMRQRLAAGAAADFSAEVRADADVYLTVAASLLAGRELAPNAGAAASAVRELYSKAAAAAGWQVVELFGVKRNEDFSQFKPRGHYTDSPELERYFRAMIWLGRTDFRMLETQSDGTQVFRRRQLEAALALHALIDAALRPNFDRIDRTVSAFVGEHDYMQLDELGSLLADLGVVSSAELASVSDQRIAQAILDGGYGTQRISSHIMINGMGGGTLPLSSSFALLGQRYVLDSHVFSNVVFDRAGSGSIPRMMPNPLDVAFAALGNDQAATLLEPEFALFDYAPDLAGMRVLADAHPDGFWSMNLYNQWLGALRSLSPNAAAIAEPSSGLPPVARSEAWGRRLLSSQLASWAELRHDTILYVKQSYTGGNSCEFPDAYVDPYPEFYAKVAAYAVFGKELAAELALAPHAPAALAGAITEHFELLGDVAGRLGQMAEHVLTGAPFTDDMLSFINDAVAVQNVCGGSFLSNPGWYGRLFFDPYSSIEFDPTIADVHTQPTDPGGTPVGRVLHVGTGYARLMVVITEGCSGPRAYAGLASSYFEHVTENFERLSDEEWLPLVPSAPDPAWLSGVVVR
jgi:hypothetical protein